MLPREVLFAGRDALVHHDEVLNCLSDCGLGGGCDTKTGNCVCVQGTTFNERTGSCGQLFVNTKDSVLYISTSFWVLRTQKAGRNLHSQQKKLKK